MKRKISFVWITALFFLASALGGCAAAHTAPDRDVSNTTCATPEKAVSVTAKPSGDIQAFGPSDVAGGPFTYKARSLDGYRPVIRPQKDAYSETEAAEGIVFSVDYSAADGVLSDGDGTLYHRECAYNEALFLPSGEPYFTGDGEALARPNTDSIVFRVPQEAMGGFSMLCTIGAVDEAGYRDIDSIELNMEYSRGSFRLSAPSRELYPRAYEPFAERLKVNGMISEWMARDGEIDTKRDVDGDGLADISITQRGWSSLQNTYEFFENAVALYNNGQADVPQSFTGVTYAPAYVDIDGDGRGEWCLLNEYASSSILDAGKLYIYDYDVTAGEWTALNEGSTILFDWDCSFNVSGKRLAVTLQSHGYGETFDLSGRDICDAYGVGADMLERGLLNDYASLAGSIFFYNITQINGRPAIEAFQAISDYGMKGAYGVCKTVFCVENSSLEILGADAMPWPDITPIKKPLSPIAAMATFSLRKTGKSPSIISPAVQTV